MSEKKPWFKARTMQADEHGNVYGLDEDPSDKHRVRVVDARELTAEKAVERVLQLGFTGQRLSDFQVGWLAEQVSMTATVVNGRVKVRRSK